MVPSYHDRDLILCLKYFYTLKVGDVVLIKVPKLGIVIKRIKCLAKDNIAIEGDNKEYSPEIYKVQYKLDEVIGKVIFKF